MSLMHGIFVTTFDLVAVFFNMVMLWNCFRLNKIKNTFVQLCKVLAVCHSACQGMIVLTDAVEWWQGFEKSRQCCNIFRVLSICMMVLQAFNITVITTIHSYHRIQEVSSLLIGIAGLHLYSSLAWWYSCLPQELLSFSGITVTVVFVSAAVFALLLCAAALKNNICNEVKDATPETTMTTYWDLCKEITPFYIKGCFLVYFIVIVTYPLSTSLLEVMIPSFTRFAVGIFIPILLMELFYLGFEEEYESGKAVVI